MFHNNDDRIMKDPRISSGRFSCRQIFAPLVRLEKPGSLTGCFHMSQIHLLVTIVLLAGQASCNETSTTPSPLTGSTTATQITVSYVVDISVDVTGQSWNESAISAWLDQVFRTKLVNCVSSNPAQTTATPTSPQTTPASTFNETTQVTVLQSNSTNATSTTLDGNNTTTAATSEGNSTTTATTSEGNNTTTATTSEGNSTTTATTPEGNNTTTATTSDGNNTTTATTSEGNSTTTAATPEGNNTTTATTSEGNNTTTATTSEGNNTTTATTSDGNNTTTATTSEGNNTTTATISEGNSTTPAATSDGNNTTTGVISEGNSTTPAATSEGNNTTTAATSEGNSTTTAATSKGNSTTTATTSEGNNTTTATTSEGNTLTTITMTATSQTNNNTTPAATTPTHISTTSATITPTRTSTTSATITPTRTSTTSATITPTRTSTTSATITPTRTSTTSATITPTRTSTTSATITPTRTSTTSVTTVITTQNTTIKSNGMNNNSPPNSNSAQKALILSRSVREVSGNETQSSLTTTGPNTMSLFQGIEVSCTTKTAIRSISCSVRLNLSQTVPSCCILRTLCAATNNASDFYVVGKKAERVDQLQNECNSSSAEENSCVYSGQANATCNVSAAAYVVPQSNSANCSANNISKINCSCSNYYSRSDAYYTFDISIQDPNINYFSTYFSSLISKVKQPPACNQTATNPCPLNDIASRYKNVFNGGCQNQSTNLQSCTVILVFGAEVSICYVASAVMSVIQSEEQLSWNGQVTQAAICGNLDVNGHPQQSEFTCVSTELTPANFCAAAESNNLTCQSGKNVVVQLQNQCNASELSTTTTGPNVTSVQPNSTTDAMNVTSAPLNTTTAPLNTTTTPLNTTTTPLNTTTTPLNTTTAPLNVTTSAANVSVTAVLNTTASNTTTIQPSTISLNTTNTTTTNQSTIQPPATTESAEGQANALLEQTKDVSKLNSSQVNQLVSQLESLLSGPTVSLALGNLSVNLVSNLLGASPDALSASSNRIIGIVDTVGLKLALGTTVQTVLSPAVAVSVKAADGANFQQTVFSISNPTNVQVSGASRRRRRAIADSSLPQGSIKLPPTLTQNLTSAEQKLVSRVQFNFYQQSTVFQDKSLGVRRLNSGILGASVANLSVRGLADNVIITLKNKEPVPANFVATCVFWDFALNNGSGGWSSIGCFVQNSTDNETICACNHLTSFAILLDLSRTPIISRIQSLILTYITYIGCGVSAIFLSVTLLTYLAFGKLRKDIPSKILIQLCLALLMLNLVFLVDAWLALYPDAVGLCISTAWFLHYFLLATFTWMGLEAVHMYMALVKVFNLNVSHYMLKFSLAGWGIPMIVVIIVIAVDKNNYGLVQYGRFTDGTTDDFCWLTKDIPFYVSVVAYFCVIFLFNAIMFIVVMVQLCRIKRQNPHNLQHRSTAQDARSVLGITVLLGLTWGFAFFAWGPVNLAFMYLFAIFNSLQGFFIFVFHCAAKENVRRQWKIYLCCGKMRLLENSEWSRTATQKTGNKSSVTNHSSSSRGNNSSSSSTFLVSDVLEQTNGIGSSFADRVITADEDPNTDVVLNEMNRRHRNPQTS